MIELAGMLGAVAAVVHHDVVMNSSSKNLLLAKKAAFGKLVHFGLTPYVVVWLNPRQPDKCLIDNQAGSVGTLQAK